MSCRPSQLKLAFLSNPCSFGRFFGRPGRDRSKTSLGVAFQVSKNRPSRCGPHIEVPLFEIWNLSKVRAGKGDNENAALFSPHAATFESSGINEMLVAMDQWTRASSHLISPELFGWMKTHFDLCFTRDVPRNMHCHLYCNLCNQGKKMKGRKEGHTNAIETEHSQDAQ